MVTNTQNFPNLARNGQTHNSIITFCIFNAPQVFHPKKSFSDFKSCNLFKYAHYLNVQIQLHLCFCNIIRLLSFAYCVFKSTSIIMHNKTTQYIREYRRSSSSRKIITRKHKSNESIWTLG